MDHDDLARPATDGTTAESFIGIVRALATEDPGFVRSLTWPAPRRLSTGNLAIVAALLATVVLGVVPLAVGLHTGIVALLVIGAVGTVLLPVATPLVVFRRLRGSGLHG